MSLPTRPSADDLTKLSKLTISTNTTSKAKKIEPVADSWEDADSGSDTETEDTGIEDRLSQMKTNESPHVPPPTPVSPTSPETYTGLYGPRGEALKSDLYSSVQRSRERDTRTPERRPDKTTSVAARLIAGGLGLRAPKRTEEEREYDRTTKEKEKQKRDEERKAKDDAEKAKKSAWEDAEKAKKSVWED